MGAIFFTQLNPYQYCYSAIFVEKTGKQKQKSNQKVKWKYGKKNLGKQSDLDFSIYFQLHTVSNLGYG